MQVIDLFTNGIKLGQKRFTLLIIRAQKPGIIQFEPIVKLTVNPATGFGILI